MTTTRTRLSRISELPTPAGELLQAAELCWSTFVEQTGIESRHVFAEVVAREVATRFGGICVVDHGHVVVRRRRHADLDVTAMVVADKIEVPDAVTYPAFEQACDVLSDALDRFEDFEDGGDADCDKCSAPTSRTLICGPCLTAEVQDAIAQLEAA